MVLFHSLSHGKLRKTAIYYSRLLDGIYIALTPMEGKHVGGIGRTSNLLICGLPTKGGKLAAYLYT